MGTEPGNRLRSHPLHSDLGHHVMVLEVKVSNPTIGQHDIRVEDFPSHRMHPTWPDRGSDVVVEPTNEVVLDVFWIQIHGRRRAWILVENFDRIGVSDLLESLVPVLDALLDPSAITYRSGVLDVETNRCDRRTDLETRVSLLKSPTGDVTDSLFVVVVAT